MEAVATDYEDVRSDYLVNAFQDFSEKILKFSPPDKGKC